MTRFNRFCFGGAVFAVVLSVLASEKTRAADEKPVERVLTLSGSIDQALQNNHRLLVAQEDIRIAEQHLREAQAHYLPQVGVNLNTARYLAEQDYVLPPDFGLVLLRPSRNFEPDTFYSARAWLKQPLYTGGRTRNNVRLSRANLERARIHDEEIRSQLVLEVTKAFNDLLLITQGMGLYETALQSVQQLVRTLPSRESRERGELQSIESRLRRELTERRRRTERARLEYLNILGLELYTRVEVKGELTTEPLDMKLAKLLAWAQESRSEIRQRDFQREMDRLTVNLSQAERFPVVAFGAAYELTDPSFPLETTQWTAVLNVSLPIFDGFSSRARIRQRRYQANQSRIQRAEVEDQVNLEVRESYLDVKHWQEERKRRAEEMKKAVQNLEAVSGRDPVARVRALTWSLEAEEAYWESVHGQSVALARLRRSIGRPLEIR